MAPPDADSPDRLRREILDDIGVILHEALAADAWGRLLVEVVRAADGEPVVSNIDVEEIVVDDGRVDALFGGESVRAVLPALAKASEALCALDGLEIEDVGGGTFVRQADERFAWLAGLVHTPSLRLDRERDALMVRLRAKNEALRARFGAAARERIDLAREAAVLRAADGAEATARATLIGTFVPAARTWGWGGHHPHVPDPVRRASAALVDGILDRDLWELSTPVFATDEATAWALAAFVCDRAGGDAVFCGPEEDGLVFVLLRGLAAVAPRA